MTLGKIFLTLLCVLIQSNAQSDYLNPHNAARAQVNVANITWDTTLATYALNYANSRKPGERQRIVHGHRWCEVVGGSINDVVDRDYDSLFRY